VPTSQGPPRRGTMATLEIEGAERGWLATVGAAASGGVAMEATLSPDVERELGTLLQRLLEEPFAGSALGARRGEDLLYALAEVFGRRRPLLGAQRVFAYVQGGSRAAPSAPPVPGWDEP